MFLIHPTIHALSSPRPIHEMPTYYAGELYYPRDDAVQRAKRRLLHEVPTAWNIDTCVVIETSMMNIPSFKITLSYETVPFYWARVYYHAIPDECPASAMHDLLDEHPNAHNIRPHSMTRLGFEHPAPTPPPCFCLVLMYEIPQTATALVVSDEPHAGVPRS